MTCLMITADDASGWGGGSQVVRQEYQALQTLGRCEIWDRHTLKGGSDPWGWDEEVIQKAGGFSRYWPFVDGDSFTDSPLRPQLTHFYSGSFPKTVEVLKRNGCRVTYTIAAHDKEVSQHEHNKLGIAFQYPHLVEPDLWKRYIEGYRLADVIICPSTVAANTVRNYGQDFKDKRIEVIPHGCELPKQVTALPMFAFVLGYMGSIGVDKGLIYLLQAWKNLNYKDAIFVTVASVGGTIRRRINPFGRLARECEELL